MLRRVIEPSSAKNSENICTICFFDLLIKRNIFVLQIFFNNFTGLLTRNSSADLMEYKNTPIQQKKKVFDAIASSSIISNCAGVDTLKSQVITLPNFIKFLETKQMEHRSEDEVREFIQVM